MNRGKSRKAAAEEAELQLTPMIDVTFLLLIFFLCSIRFKVLDGKLVSHLPREAGVNTFAPTGEFERIDIVLSRTKSARAGFSIRLNGKDIPDLCSLGSVLRNLHRREPGLAVAIHPGEKIEHGHVVAVVNECLRAGFTRIAFSGTPLDG